MLSLNLLILVYILFQDENNFIDPLLQVGSGSRFNDKSNEAGSGEQKINGSGSSSLIDRHRGAQTPLTSADAVRRDKNEEILRTDIALATITVIGTLKIIIIFNKIYTRLYLYF